MFVSGPVATIVTGSPAASRVSLISSTAVRGSASTAGGGSSGPPSALSPWIPTAGDSSRTMGLSAPGAIGTPVMPASPATTLAL